MLILESDGGCIPNPGQGKFGFVVKLDGKTIHRYSEEIGLATNNIAEWRGALAALNYAVGATMFGPRKHVTLLMDSQLVVNQLQGRWRAKHPGLKPLLAEGLALLEALGDQGVFVKVKWIPRLRNHDADALTRPEQIWSSR